MLKLYEDLAWLWPIWGSPEEYADFCSHVVGLIRDHTQIPTRTLLNMGCGGGKNVFNLKQHYEVTGLDLSPNMLALARELNPECVFLQDDMRSFVLDGCFDAILIDDAVSYMITRADLKASFAAAWRHLRAGGVMVVGPDLTKETFVQNRTLSTSATGRSKAVNAEVVFIENEYDPDPTDDHYEGTIVYLIREDGRLRIETDRHILGLFSLEVWRETLQEVGFRVHQTSYIEDDSDYVIFACLKPR